MDSDIEASLVPKFVQNLSFHDIDGKEPMKKIVQTTATGTFLGLGISTVGLSMYFPKTFTESVGRTVNHTATFATLGAVFGAGTSICASVREKDGPLNYFVGGCLAGVVYGAKAHSYAVGTGTCAAFGGWGALYKVWKDQGWEDFLPKPSC